jgi:hypothetical protein
MNAKDGKSNTGCLSHNSARWPRFHAYATVVGKENGDYSGLVNKNIKNEKSHSNRAEDSADYGKQFDPGEKPSDISNGKHLGDDMGDDSGVLNRPRRVRNKPALFSEYHQIVRRAFFESLQGNSSHIYF